MIRISLAALLTSGCVVTTVAGTAVDVTTGVVGGAVDVTTGAVDLVTGGSDDEEDEED